MAVIGDILLRGLEAPLHPGDVPQPDHRPGRVAIDDFPRHFPFADHGAEHMDRRMDAAGLHRPARDGQGRGLVAQHQGGRTEPVGREPLRIEGHGDFLLLGTQDAHLGEFGNLPETVGEVFGIVQDLAVALVGRFDGDQQGGDFAEGVQHGDGQHARRQQHLGLLETQFDLRPYLILRFLRRGQVGDNVAHPVAADRAGVVPGDFLKGEQRVFQGFGELFLHLGGRGAGVDADHQALLDVEGGEFVLIHPEGSPDAGQDAGQDQAIDDPLVADRPGHPRAYALDLSHRRVSTCMPVETLRAPSTISSSPSCRPPVTRMSSPL